LVGKFLMFRPFPVGMPASQTCPVEFAMKTGLLLATTRLPGGWPRHPNKGCPTRRGLRLLRNY
jgi:hypothetical protein